MPKGANVPDAWEDDWETQADKAEEQDNKEPAPAQQAPLLTKAERLAQHAESNRKLWQAADAPEEFHYVSTSNSVPLAATNFKPAMKVLSRKPAPRMIAKRDPVTGLEQLTLEDDRDEDDEAKKAQPTPEEIRTRQQKELEEKQRRYEEARAKIFGESAPSSGASTPGNVTPPQQSERRPNHRGKGRGRGGHRNDSHSRHDSQTRRPANQQAATSPRELYDPDYSPKPGFSLQKRGGGNGSPARPSTPRDEDQVIRGPRGPDSSGRGGFGFARRGAKEG